ncbi:MAG: leucyl aminopeptidase [Chlorobi bacterium]|nr:leucyl aminopeptidase [Chlorobiota bacterium]
MNIKVQEYKPQSFTSDCTVLFFTKESYKIETKKYPELSGLIESGDFTAEKGAVSVAYSGSNKSSRTIVVGLGETSKVSIENIRVASASASQRAKALKCKTIAFLLPTIENLGLEDISVATIEGSVLGTYSYNKYFTMKKDIVNIENIILLTEKNNIKIVQEGVRIGKCITEGVCFSRDLINAPSNELFPMELASRAKSLSKLGVKVTILGKKELVKNKMGGILAVSQGSQYEPAVVVMEYNGGGKERPIGLVGKGLCFDSGGISIKGAAGMGEMKMDMGGAGAVVGAMHSIASLKLKKNVVAVIGCSENMPSGTAYKPGDVITFMNGKTAEIDNTDAEGRIVLGDCLTFIDKYKPSHVVDFATLTGAICVALGNVTSGLFGKDEDFNSKLKSAGERTYDRVWEMPLHEEYEELIKSDIADVKNSGGKLGGSITAALFLQHFIGNYKWAHIDIAGTGIFPSQKGYLNKGGTGAGARLIIDLVRNWN